MPRIIDGLSERLSRVNVLAVGSRFERISFEPIEAPPDAEIIEADGRVLMPGPIDATGTRCSRRTRSLISRWPIRSDVRQRRGRGGAGPCCAASPRCATFGGSNFGIKAAIDRGLIPGPRGFPSGAFISQTSGHGDFPPPYERPQTLGGRPSLLEELGQLTVANGMPEVLTAVRKQLEKGANQIKIGAGGCRLGHLRACHIYTPVGIWRALKAGVLSIEDAHLATRQASGRHAMIALVRKQEAGRIDASRSRSLPQDAGGGAGRDCGRGRVLERSGESRRGGGWALRVRGGYDWYLLPALLPDTNAAAAECPLFL
jgi:hypothetical protein